MSETIYRSGWLDLIFADKNKEYGAYVLRKEHEKNTILGLFLSNGLLLGIFTIAWLAHLNGDAPVKKTSDSDIYKIIDVVINKPPKIVSPPTTIKTAVGQKANSVRLVPPVVTPDIDVLPTETIPTTIDIENKVISTVNNTGTDVSYGNATIGTGTDPITISIPVPAMEIPVVDYADKMPVFPKKYGTMASYLGSRIRIPQPALDNNISDKVFIEFIIDSEGNITNVSTLRGIGYGCDEEAMRIIASMPRWEPGSVGGKPVSVRFRIPIYFKTEAN